MLAHVLALGVDVGAVFATLAMFGCGGAGGLDCGDEDGGDGGGGAVLASVSVAPVLFLRLWRWRRRQ